jgi:hypothetical protein
MTAQHKHHNKPQGQVATVLMCKALLLQVQLAGANAALFKGDSEADDR